MTEADIIRILTMTLDTKRFPFQMPNAFIYGHECDYWAMDEAGITREYEVKISRADYFKDAEKHKHITLDSANYFYYVVPQGLIKPDEVDKKYGLIEVVGGLLSLTKKPRQLHGRPFDQWKKLANKLNWRFRDLWIEKYRAKEITRDEYRQGLLVDLHETDSLSTPD